MTYPITHAEAVRKAYDAAVAADRVIGPMASAGEWLALGQLWAAVAAQLPVVEDAEAEQLAPPPVPGSPEVALADTVVLKPAVTWSCVCPHEWFGTSGKRIGTVPGCPEHGGPL